MHQLLFAILMEFPFKSVESFYVAQMLKRKLFLMFNRHIGNDNSYNLI